MRMLQLTYYNGHTEKFGVPSGYDPPDISAGTEWLKLPPVDKQTASILVRLSGVRFLSAFDEVRPARGVVAK